MTVATPLRASIADLTRRPERPRGWHGELSPEAARATRKQIEEPKRILLVEDEYLVAAEAEAALGEAGLEVVGIAASAEEAVVLAERARPDLVVMDVRLSGERDGIDAALTIFRSHGIRSIFATAHYDPSTLARARAAQPLGWLPKPYMMNSLVFKVLSALRSELS